MDDGSYQARSCLGEETRIGATLGARSGPVRRRSRVLRAKVIVVPPWDSPAALRGVSGTTTSSSLLFSEVVSRAGRLPAALSSLGPSVHAGRYLTHESFWASPV